jgi:hypothetical protein
MESSYKTLVPSDIMMPTCVALYTNIIYSMEMLKRALPQSPNVSTMTTTTTFFLRGEAVPRLYPKVM